MPTSKKMQYCSNSHQIIFQCGLIALVAIISSICKKKSNIYLMMSVMEHVTKIRPKHRTRNNTDIYWIIESCEPHVLFGRYPAGIVQRGLFEILLSASIDQVQKTPMFASKLISWAEKTRDLCLTSSWQSHVGPDISHVCIYCIYTTYGSVILHPPPSGVSSYRYSTQYQRPDSK